MGTGNCRRSGLGILHCPFDPVLPQTSTLRDFWKRPEISDYSPACRRQGLLTIAPIRDVLNTKKNLCNPF
jgi:hypothetical protein